MAVWMFMLTQFAFALSADFFQGQEQVFKIRLKIVRDANEVYI